MASSHAHLSCKIMGVATCDHATCSLKTINMATVLAALAGCFWWFVDVILCFMVSSSIITIVGIVAVFLYKRLQPAAEEDKTLKEMVEKYDELTLTGRVAIISSPFVVFVSAVMWRVWDIVMNDSTRMQCEDKLEEGVMLSSVLPTWFAPFWIVYDYEMHLAVVPLRLTKMLFISAFLLSFPLIITAFHYVSKYDKPLLKVGLWLIKKHERWSNVDCRGHLQRILELEWAEEQYMKTILKATLRCMEKEAEVKQLEEKIRQLENNIVEVNQWVNSERRLTNNFECKNREIERKLHYEKRRSQTLESRCRDLTRKLEKERRESAHLERKTHEQQRKLSTLEKRPVVVKQQVKVSGDDILCVICMERKRQYLLRPCNHYCVCNNCKSTLQNKCPLCRKLIRSYEKIFIS